MMASPAFAPVIVEEKQQNNIIPFSVIIGTKDVKPKSPKARDNSGGLKPAGVSSEVYAFRTDEEIKSMIDVFDKHINEATDEHHRQLASRNKLLFVIGINVGLRASDLITLKWSFFLDGVEDGEYKFKDFYTLQPKKTRKQKKFVKLFFNNTVKKVIVEHLNEFPMDNLDEYMFKSREGDGAIAATSLWRIIKNAAKEAGINQNIGSHSLRKTWGRFCFEQAEDKTRALVLLQKAFNHSSQEVTLHYLGLLDEDIQDMYENVNIGYDFI